MSKDEKDYEIGEECIFTEEGCAIHVRVLSKSIINNYLCFQLVVVERLNPNFANRYPNDSEVGKILKVGKQLDMPVPCLLWTLEELEEHAPRSRRTH